MSEGRFCSCALFPEFEDEVEPELGFELPEFELPTFPVVELGLVSPDLEEELSGVFFVTSPLILAALLLVGEFEIMLNAINRKAAIMINRTRAVTIIVIVFMFFLIF